MGLKERANTPPRPLPIAVHIICFMSEQSLSVRLFTAAVSLPPPAAPKQIIYLLNILMATHPNFYQPDAADAASEGLNESNPDQINWVFFPPLT